MEAVENRTAQISFKRDDIFKSKAQALVNPVNIMGVSGKGLALEFKKRFPDNFKAYQDACGSGKCYIGKCFTYQTENGLYIINLPTKKDWRNPSSMDYIKSGLDSLSIQLIIANLKSVAIPALGCGLGGLEWKFVKEVIIQKLEVPSLRGIEIEVYEPERG